MICKWAKWFPIKSKNRLERQSSAVYMINSKGKLVVQKVKQKTFNFFYCKISIYPKNLYEEVNDIIRPGGLFELVYF